MLSSSSLNLRITLNSSLTILFRTTEIPSSELFSSIDLLLTCVRKQTFIFNLRPITQIYIIFIVLYLSHHSSPVTNQFMPNRFSFPSNTLSPINSATTDPLLSS
ncbi:hypothetical protein AMECASPLE_036045 [Ameca splendens]|uniref:Uncharacterized protein n=1 Tax=Ameca splendens TaxID=208324 RepID=A0ABV0XWE4_9TELE